MRGRQPTAELINNLTNRSRQRVRNNYHCQSTAEWHEVHIKHYKLLSPMSMSFQQRILTFGIEWIEQRIPIPTTPEYVFLFSQQSIEKKIDLANRSRNCHRLPFATIDFCPSITFLQIIIINVLCQFPTANPSKLLPFFFLSSGIEFRTTSRRWEPRDLGFVIAKVSSVDRMSYTFTIISN